MKGTLSLFALALSLGALAASQFKDAPSRYKVVPPTSQGSLTVFPIVSATTYDTSSFLTLDEGIRSGQVVVTEAGQASGLVRPRGNINDGVLRTHPFIATGARVNELSLTNNSNRPLLLLAGEIVTGGKQDRVVGKDRIIPAHSQPIDLGVFCVEPHRWTETYANFATPQALMAQPSVRAKAMVDKDQRQVWNEVAKSQSDIVSSLPAAAPMVHGTSSYAASMGNRAVQARIDSVAKPLEQSYDRLMQTLRAEKAVGAVVAVNGEIIWADAFASPDLLSRFWPKLIRSYAAESFGQIEPISSKHWPTQDAAQAFLDHLGVTHESIDTEPNLYRLTEITGDSYSAFLLTSLLPDTGFTLHLAKMKH